MADLQNSKRLDEPEVLLFETSPYGTLDGIVQHDGCSVYFYLNQPANNGNFGTRACWVRNLQLGPMVLNEKEMQQGVAPQLPRTHCVDRDSQPLPTPDSLSIIWFEEGNGAALVETIEGNHTTIAVIPPWSGLEGFSGYASQCATESKICSPMPDNPNLRLRISRAAEFWSTVGDSNSQNSFSKLQTGLLESYESRFSDANNPEPEYYRIDGSKFPPRGLVHIQTEPNSYIFTVGMSLCPQPAVELFNDNPVNLRRIELGLRIPNANKDVVQSAIQRLSNLASYPWRNFTWLGDGHTCELKDVFESTQHALLVNNSHLAATEKELFYRDDKINLLWLLPISEQQVNGLMEKRISANDIVMQYAEKN